MRRRIWLIIFSCFFYLNSYATHNIDEVVFSINEKRGFFLIEASFPWTIREALLSFEPTLKNANTKKEYEQAFFRYITKHFVIKDNNDKKLSLVEIKEIKNKDHSHGNDFVLKFKGNSISSIKNTVLFEQSKSPKNIHYYEGKVYKTNLVNEVIRVKQSNIYFVWISVLGIIVIISLYNLLKTNEYEN